MVIFVVFAFKNAEIPIFCEHEPEHAQKGPPKNDNFSHFTKHTFKKNVLLQPPPSWPNICVFSLSF